MKSIKIKVILYVFLSGILLTPKYIYGQEMSIPSPTNYVNDYAEMIPQIDEDSLNLIISQYEKTSGVELAIVTLKDLGGDDMFNVAQNIFDKWGIGKKGSDNGILIIVCESTHDWRIHTGYGAEILLPDIAAGRLAQEYMIPSFKEGNYGAGFEKIVNAIINKIGTNSEDIERFKQEQLLLKEQQQEETIRIIVWVLVIILCVIILGVLIGYLINKFEEKIKIKKECKRYSDNISINLKTLEQKSHSLDTAFTRNLLEKTKELIKQFESVKNEKPSQDLINKLSSLSPNITSIDSRLDEYQESYRMVTETCTYSDDVKKSLSNIEKVKEYLKDFDYVIGFGSYSLGHIETLFQKAREVKEHETLLQYTREIKSYISKIKLSEQSLEKVKSSIFMLQNDLKKYKETIEGLIKILKFYSCVAAINKVQEMTTIFKSKLTFQKNKLFTEHKELENIIYYANSEINKAKTEKEEEEIRIRRQRERSSSSSYSSYRSSSYRSSSRSSGSSFGGFGGGRSGGGGAGGRW